MDEQLAQKLKRFISKILIPVDIAAFLITFISVAVVVLVTIMQGLAGLWEMLFASEDDVIFLIVSVLSAAWYTVRVKFYKI